MIVMVNVRGTPVSCPPFAVPPSSIGVTVIVAVPSVSAFGVYVSVPLELVAGWTRTATAC
jgi:hypothetical protein